MSLSSVALLLRQGPSCPLVTSLRTLSLTCRMENAAAAAESKIPKRPVSPWIRYYSANYALMKKTHPNLKTTEIMKQLSSKWNMLSDNQKTQFVTAYEKEKVMYESKVAKIPQAVLDEASKESAKKRLTKLKNTAQTELRELLTSLNKPSRPVNGYTLYVASQFKAKAGKGVQDSSKTSTDSMKSIAASWKLLTDQQKMPFIRKAEAAAEKYKKDLLTWTNKMNKMGKLDTIMDAETKLAMAKMKLKDLDN